MSCFIIINAPLKTFLDTNIFNNEFINLNTMTFSMECKFFFLHMMATFIQSNASDTEINVFRVLFNKTNKTHEFSKFYFVKKLYMFQAFPLPIIRSFLLYVRHWYISCRFDDSF